MVQKLCRVHLWHGFAGVQKLISVIAFLTTCVWFWVQWHEIDCNHTSVFEPITWLNVFTPLAHLLNVTVRGFGFPTSCMTIITGKDLFLWGHLKTDGDKGSENLMTTEMKSKSRLNEHLVTELSILHFLKFMSWATELTMFISPSESFYLRGLCCQKLYSSSILKCAKCCCLGRI